MSGDARISGRIVITPPITWAELRQHRWAFEAGHGAGIWPDAIVRVTEFATDTDDGTVIRKAGDAIIPVEGETNGYDLTENVIRIVRQFGTAPDGAGRTFTGWLHLNWAGGAEVYRVHVVDGVVVESRPTLTWPVGARDKDAR